MEKIRIILVVAGLAIGDQNGGAEYFAVQLARRLDKKIFEPLLFAMWQYGSPAEKRWLSLLEQEGIQVFGLTPQHGPIIKQLAYISLKLWNTTRVFRPLLINSHSQRGDIPNIIMHLLHPFHPFSIRTIHIDQPWLNRRFLDLIFNGLLFPLCFDKEIAISRKVQQKLDTRLIARLLRKKTILIYNGIDRMELRASQSQEQLPDLLLNKPCVGVIARLTRQKGHEYLLSAMKIVLEHKPVHLYIIGTGPLGLKLRELSSKLGINNFTHFVGSRSDVSRILPQLDAMISPSLWEGFPTVLLEAMTLSVPVVATDVPGTDELVKDGITGLLVPKKSPTHLANAILATLEDPARALEMAKSARQFSEQFNIQNVIIQYSQVYLDFKSK